MTKTSTFQAAAELEAVRDKPILVTGAAGFIGYHVSKRLLNDGYEVVGVDSVNSYYDPRLKRARLDQLETSPGFRFHRIDIAERGPTKSLFENERPGLVVHLAAQAGVRYSIENPHAYGDSNLQGFLNILEGCRHISVRHLL